MRESLLLDILLDLLVEIINFWLLLLNRCQFAACISNISSVTYDMAALPSPPLGVGVIPD